MIIGRASSRTLSRCSQSQPRFLFRGSSIPPIKVARGRERQISIFLSRASVVHPHLGMSEAAKPSESNGTPSNISEFLLAQKSAYLRAVAEGVHKDIWTISMGNEAGG
jgi:hypothetical protein